MHSRGKRVNKTGVPLTHGTLGKESQKTGAHGQVIDNPELNSTKTGGVLVLKVRGIPGRVRTPVETLQS